MDVRIVGVPVIDGNPVELCAEVALGIGHQLAGEDLEVGHLSRILRRHDEAEVVAVIFASFSEGALIDGIGPCIEHTGIYAITGDAVALEISDVLCKRRRAEFISPMPDHPRFDYNPT